MRNVLDRNVVKTINNQANMINSRKLIKVEYNYKGHTLLFAHRMRRHALENIAMTK